MQITFADGTRIEVPAAALDNFIRHDLKWVEFVHGRASAQQLDGLRQPSKAVSSTVKRCPSASPSGC